MGAVEDGGGFSFPLPDPSAKQHRRCQNPAIVVVIIMLGVVVVDMAVVGLSTLAYLADLSLDLVLALDLVTLPIAIYPILPAPYSFNLYLDPISVPVPGLDHHQISDHP